ncbi:hypothetical protein OKL56_11515 [Enterococcus hirae]|uniref:hypothetical protein n=1 Tax=Enterococcus hirae TaxID=1354 RepID=UPI00221EF92A|nr:hypothetical protein [Enterococcus hirae]MDT2663580.1 hypothetical protein [Enterococcus hirae]MDW3666057.1 hypothetical protein [Enterococcus hirae]UYT92516.1 hypothetical protein OKL56_11515 [Enterococcus hirae]
MEKWIAELFKETEIEKLQKKSGKNINTMNLNYHRSIVPEIPKSKFFEFGSIAINKHRFCCKVLNLLSNKVE